MIVLYAVVGAACGFAVAAFVFIHVASFKVEASGKTSIITLIGLVASVVVGIWINADPEGGAAESSNTPLITAGAAAIVTLVVLVYFGFWGRTKQWLAGKPKQAQPASKPRPAGDVRPRRARQAHTLRSAAPS